MADELTRMSAPVTPPLCSLADMAARGDDEQRRPVSLPLKLGKRLSASLGALAAAERHRLLSPLGERVNPPVHMLGPLAEHQAVPAADRGPGMDELRDRAGVSLKRGYAAFPSKADLVEAYLTRRDERWRDAVEGYVARRSDDPREQLLLVFDALQSWIRSQPDFRGCAFHNAVGELGGTSPIATSIVRSNKHHLLAFLRRTAGRARLRRPAEVAGQLMLLAEGALITAAIDGDPDVPERAKAAARVIIDAAG